MKAGKKLLIWLTVAMLLLASVPVAAAIGFSAEEIYNSVFVVLSGNSLGSGFAVGENCIVTNAHVISDPRQITIVTYSGQRYSASVIGMDEAQDIAVLGVAGAQFPYLTMADSDAMNIGDDIYAIGAPKSMAYTLTKGVISAKDRQVRNESYIQIDAPINEGNSGGPLLNDLGQVIGMNTLKMTDSEGIGLAIPMRRICAYLEYLALPLDAAGNVTGAVELPQLPQSGMETTAPSDANEKYPESGKVPDAGDNTGGQSPLNTVVIGVAAVSVILNVVLLVLLMYEKRKNLTLKFDPRERTDFDIDIWE